MKRAGCLIVAVFMLTILGALGWFAAGWWGSSSVDEDSAFIVPSGATLTSTARKLEEEGRIGDADAFLLRAKVLGGSGHVQAGEFLLPANVSNAGILAILQDGQPIRRSVTIPEGLPSILVHERLMAEEMLSGSIDIPAEGSILPDTYDFERGEDRAAVIGRMQLAMEEFLEEAWPNRSATTAVNSPREAVILASVVEKETALAEERRMVAGALSNRVRIGMMLGADATTIYPITKGRPLGRRIRVSELRDPNPYNTRAISGLPVGPITNPGRESILAVLDPAETKALYYVADGTGGHVFAETLEEHNRNAARWRALRRERGEM